MEIIDLVAATSLAYEAYTQSSSDWNRAVLNHCVAEVFINISQRENQSVKVLNQLFARYPVLKQACTILSETTPTSQDTRNTNFLVSRPTPS
jgi:sulfur relay (sulfurtransferase) DsrC/TusE family protein